MRINGKRVVDAKKPFRLEITEDDIERGHGLDPLSCAAAVAAVRQLKVPRTKVHRSRLYVERKTHWERYEVPAALEREITALDRGGEFIPGEYTIAVPPRPSIQLKAKGYARHTKTYPPTGKQPQKGRNHVVQKVRQNANAGSRKRD